jgi:hypothetical protein
MASALLSVLLKTLLEVVPVGAEVVSVVVLVISVAVCISWSTKVHPGDRRYTVESNCIIKPPPATVTTTHKQFKQINVRIEIFGENKRLTHRSPLEQ